MVVVVVPRASVSFVSSKQLNEDTTGSLVKRWSVGLAWSARQRGLLPGQTLRFLVCFESKFQSAPSTFSLRLEIRPFEASCQKLHCFLGKCVQQSCFPFNRKMWRVKNLITTGLIKYLLLLTAVPL